MYDVTKFIVYFRGTCHQSVTDFQFLVNKAVGRVLDVRYTLSPKIAMSLTNKASLGFIRKHLGDLIVLIEIYIIYTFVYASQVVLCFFNPKFRYYFVGLQGKDTHEDVLSGDHDLIIKGTNVDMS